MKPAGRFVADVLTRLAEAADVGVNLLELDALAHDLIRERGAESCYIDYHPSFGAMPFGKVLCTSVNDAVLHGLPHDYVLRDGDLLSVDFAASVDGWVSDSALSVVVGTPDPQDLAPDRHRHPGPGRRDRGRAGRFPDRGHLRGHRPGRARRRALDQHRLRWPRRRPDHARRPARPEQRPPGSRLPAQAGSRDRHRAVVPADHGRALHRPGRLDAAQRRRFARSAHGAHHRDHRRRSAGADRARPRATSGTAARGP